MVDTVSAEMFGEPLYPEIWGKAAVSFYTIITEHIFQDENAIEFRGNVSTELRIIRIGKTFSKIIIVVVYTIRVAMIRIISAISFKVHISDAEVRLWANQNYDKMGRILGNFITDIYKANQIIKE